jgi:hypothetical protein
MNVVGEARVELNGGHEGPAGLQSAPAPYGTTHPCERATHGQGGMA